MPSAEIVFEHSTFVGLAFALVLYGIQLTLYFLSCRLLLLKRPRMQNGRFYVAYSTLMLFFLTISLVTNSAFGDLMWIDDRNFPGGPAAYYANNASAWYNTLGTATDVTANAMADGLLARCYMFWVDRRWVTVFPALLYVSSIVMSIMMTIESALPGAAIFQGTPTRFLITWMALTVSFNVVVTLTIIWRLVSVYRMVREASSPARSYLDVSAMLIESALPLSALGLGCLITQCLNSNVTVAFSFVWGTFVVLAPQLIIYRVALGVAWSSDNSFTISQGSMHFATGPRINVKQPHVPGASGAESSTVGFSSNMDLQLYKEEAEVNV